MSPSGEFGIRTKVPLTWFALTPNGVPEEDTASLKATLDFINPLIVEVHPRGLRANNLAWLSVLPKSRSIEVLVGRNRVQAPFAFSSVSEEVDGGAKNGSSGRGPRISLAPNEENNRAKQEDDGRKGVGEIESDKLIDSDWADGQWRKVV